MVARMFKPSGFFMPDCHIQATKERKTFRTASSCSGEILSHSSGATLKSACSMAGNWVAFVPLSYGGAVNSWVKRTNRRRSYQRGGLQARYYRRDEPS